MPRPRKSAAALTGAATITLVAMMAQPMAIAAPVHRATDTHGGKAGRSTTKAGSDRVHREHFDSRREGKAGLALTKKAALTAAKPPAKVAELKQRLGNQGLVTIDPLTSSPRQIARADGFLTGPSKAKPRDIVMGYVQANHAVFGLDASALKGLSLRRDYVDVDGTHHLSFVQKVSGIPVFGNGLVAHVTKDGRLIAFTGSPLASLTGLPGATPGITAPTARGSAVKDAGGKASAVDFKRLRGATSETRFDNGDRASLVCNRVSSTAGLIVWVVAFAYYGLSVAEWWMRHFIVSTAPGAAHLRRHRPHRHAAAAAPDHRPDLEGDLLRAAAGLRHLPVRVRRAAAGALPRSPTCPHADEPLPEGQRSCCSAATYGAVGGRARTTRAAVGPPPQPGAPARPRGTTPSRSPAPAPRRETRAGRGSAPSVRQAERRCGSTCTPTPRSPTAPTPRPSCSRRAAAAGLDVVALTDHDTTAGWDGGRGGPPRRADRSCPAWSCPAAGSRRRAADQRAPAGLPVRPGRRRRSPPSGPGCATSGCERGGADRRRAGRRRLPGQLGRRSSSARERRRRRPPAHRPRAGRGRRRGLASTTPSPTLLHHRSPYYVAQGRHRRLRRRSALVRAAGGVPVFAHGLATTRGPVVGDDAIAAMAAAGLLGLEVDHPDHDARRAGPPARRSPTSSA